MVTISSKRTSLNGTLKRSRSLLRFILVWTSPYLSVNFGIISLVSVDSDCNSKYCNLNWLSRSCLYSINIGISFANIFAPSAFMLSVYPCNIFLEPILLVS